MSFDGDSSYSRLRTGRTRTQPPQPTRAQKAMEVSLFAIFGLIIALAGVALYATNRPEHKKVPNHVAAGLAADRVNVLLIGSSLRLRKGGPHEVQIESLMLLSVQPSTGRAALMSIPVDLWVKVGRYGMRPLSAAHTIGDASGYPGGGAGLTLETVEDFIGQHIHAYVRHSIGDVQRLVDALGGVEVDVPRGVFDYRYKLKFRRGVDHFDGNEAMRYAYSSSVAAPATNRFARERRQRDVIVAALSKALQSRDDLSAFREVFGPMTATNLSATDTARLVSALRRGDDIRRISFAAHLDAFAVNSAAYRGEAVRPRSGNYATLQNIAAAAFDTGVARVH